MCFEFEWLYWAQLAQDDERKRKDAEDEARQAKELSSSIPQRPMRTEEQEPAHI